MFTFTGNTSTGSAVITAVASTAGIEVGGYLSGADIPAGAAVVSFVTDSSVTMSANAIGGTSGLTITFRRNISYASSPQSSAIVALALAVSSVIALAASPSSAAAVDFSLTGATASLTAAPSSTFDASASLVGSTVSVSATPAASFSVTSVLSGATAEAQAAPSSAWNSTVSLSGATAAISAGGFSSFIATTALTGSSELRGRTICDLIKESLALWGFLCSKNAPDYALERAVTDVNTALQLVWNNAEGHDYWSNETLTIVLADGEDSFTLADDVQNVVGPCRRSDNNRPLAPVRTTGELETFADIYLNGESAGEPLAYHVDRSKQSADDPAKCVLRVSPAVSGASVSLRLDVVKECPRYTTGDLNACPLVPIPHQYTETLLVPIIRYQACSFYLFTPMDGAQKETIEREYQQARISLGLADPNPVKTSVAKEVSK